MPSVIAEAAKASDPLQMRSDSPAAAREVLAGLVERVTFHNEENGFCVLRTKARGQRDLRVTRATRTSKPSARSKRSGSREVNERTGEPLSKATLLSTLNALKAFFTWLSRQHACSQESALLAAGVGADLRRGRPSPSSARPSRARSSRTRTKSPSISLRKRCRNVAIVSWSGMGVGGDVAERHAAVSRALQLPARKHRSPRDTPVA